MIQNIKRTQVNDNLTVVSEKIPNVSSVSLGFWICRGSRNESLRKSGLHHFYEHIIFKATKNRSAFEIVNSLEKSGGHLNAFTSKEQICVLCKSIDEELSTAADVLKDLYNNPLFDKLDIEKERQVISEEIRYVEDNPEEYVHDLVLTLLWPKNNLGNPIAGYRDSIEKISKKDLIRCYSEIKGSRLIISASGNIDHESFLKYFNDINFKENKKQAKNKRFHLKKPQRKVFYKHIKQANICIAFRTCSYTSDHKYPLLILNAILGDGMSSRLFQRLREELGLAYSVYTFLDFYYDTGLFGVYIGTHSKNSIKALEVLIKELNNLKQVEISKQELDFAKSYIKGNILLSMENTTTRMTHLARSEIYYSKKYNLNESIKKIQKVSNNDINEVLSSYFTNSNVAIASVTPSKNDQFENYVLEVNIDKV